MNISLFFFTMQRETFSWWVSNNQEQQQQQNIHNIKEIIAIVISENIEWEMVTAAVHHHHLTLCSHSQFELWMEYTKWIEITECDATGAAEYAFSHNVNIRIAQTNRMDFIMTGAQFDRIEYHERIHTLRTLNIDLNDQLCIQPYRRWLVIVINTDGIDCVLLMLCLCMYTITNCGATGL